MSRERLVHSAAKAHELAEQLAHIVRESDVPPAHLDEVFERLKELLEDKPEIAEEGE